MKKNANYSDVAEIYETVYRARPNAQWTPQTPEKANKDYALLVLGIVGVVHNFTCRPNGGAEVTGSRYTFYDLIFHDNEWKAELHSFVIEAAASTTIQWPSKYEEAMYPNRARTYEEVEPKMLACYTPLLRSRKKVALSTLCGYFFEEGLEGRSTMIEAMASRIRTLLETELPPIRIEEHRGVTATTTAYRNFEEWCHSCMTGDNAEYTEIWGTNPKQCRLITLFDENGNEPVARTLVFRPMTTTLRIADSEALSDDPIGAGWYYGRVYGNTDHPQFASSDRCARVAIAHLESIGLMPAGSASDGVVPLKPTEYSPFIDQGLIWWSAADGRAVWAMDRDRNPTLEKWKGTVIRPSAIESYTDGSGFGNTRFDSVCTCCECEYDSEDDGAAYVENYGSVCPGCLEDNETFVVDYDGYHRTADDCMHFVSALYSRGSWYASERNGCTISDNVWVRRGVNNVAMSRRREDDPTRWTSERTAVTVVEFEDEDVYVPTVEALKLADGSWVWQHDPSLIEVSKELRLVDGRLYVYNLDKPVNDLTRSCVLYNDEQILDATDCPLISTCKLVHDKKNGIYMEFDGDKKATRVLRWGNYWFAVNESNIVIASSVPLYLTTELGAPLLGNYWNGNGYPLELLMERASVPFRHDTGDVWHQWLFFVSVGDSVTNADTRCVGNYNGYSIPHSHGILGAFLRTLLADGCRFYNDASELCTTFVDNNGESIGKQAIGGMILVGEVQVYTTTTGTILGLSVVDYGYKGSMKLIGAAHLRGDLRSLITAYNNNRITSNLMLVLDMVQKLSYSMPHNTNNDHPLRSATYFTTNIEISL